MCPPVLYWGMVRAQPGAGADPPECRVDTDPLSSEQKTPHARRSLGAIREEEYHADNPAIATTYFPMTPSRHMATGLFRACDAKRSHHRRAKPQAAHVTDNAESYRRKVETAQTSAGLL